MVINGELLKAEIDRIPEQYLDILYRIIQAFLNPLNTRLHPQQSSNFVQETYGCLADDPIARGEQGKLQIRDKLE